MNTKHFYLLFFENTPYFKIGRTKNLKLRLYNYLFPYEDRMKKLYENKKINFRRSVIIPDNPNNLELYLKRKYVAHIYKYFYGKTFGREVLDISCLDKLLEEACAFPFLTYFDATAYSNSEALKEVLTASGVNSNACHFFSTQKGKMDLSFDFRYKF